MTHAETNLVRDWFTRRRDESYKYVSFETHPKIENWTHCWQCFSLEKALTRYNKDGRDLYCIPGGQEKYLSIRDCTIYFKTVNELS